LVLSSGATTAVRCARCTDTRAARRFRDALREGRDGEGVYGLGGMKGYVGVGAEWYGVGEE
jgi:hypothetical protein